MTDIGQEALAIRSDRLFISARTAAILPPLAALLYPFAVWGFFGAVGWVRASEGPEKIVALYCAVAALSLTAAPSLLSYLLLLRPIDRADRFAGVRWIALLAFAAPALFTVERVIFAGLRWTFDDRFVWASIWLALIAVAARGRPRRSEAQPAWATRLRFAHGVSAALILALFLFAHLGNHLVGLLGDQIHIETMAMLRLWYRAGLVEPILILLFAFQMGSGVYLASIRQYASPEAFRTLQVATGVGLLTFLLAHMLVVFVVARWANGIDTNWTFATGFKVGILGNLSNARQAPYYGFAMFCTAAHLACGLRIVLLAHGWRTASANRLTIGIIVAGSLFAVATLAGMLGVRVG